jgi:glycosyltransferase involved in cell wall biosynthesis
MHIAVIASMKKGLEHFVYRELLTFTAQGHSISLFPTKYRSGLYNAKDGWALHIWHPASLVLWQFYFLISSPILYMRLLREALITRSVVDFALAWYFSRNLSGVDIIYATFGDHKLFIGYFCQQIVKKPLVVTIHAYELYHNPNLRLFTQALLACDQIITVTEYNKEILAHQYGVDPSKVEVVRINVNVEDYRPQKKFVILIVAFFAERKGHEILFKAIKQLSMDDLEVWVVGDAGVEDNAIDVRRLATQLGIDSQVAFFGNLGGTALKAMFRSCDVFCLPCRTDSTGLAEGFPTVLAEAMAFGRPIITTNHVEIPRIISEIIVNENDVNGLADAIRQVYQSATLRQRLGENNRKIAEERFSTRNAIRTARIFQDVVRQYQDSSFQQPTRPAQPDNRENAVEVLPR